MSRFEVTLKYTSVVTVTVDGETEAEAVTNAYDCAEDNFEGKWEIQSVTKRHTWYEICTHLMVPFKEGDDSEGLIHIDPDDVKPGQKVRYAIWVREYFSDPETGEDFEILEDEDFATEAERDARFEQLDLKYPNAEINAY